MERTGFMGHMSCPSRSHSERWTEVGTHDSRERFEHGEVITLRREFWRFSSQEFDTIPKLECRNPSEGLVPPSLQQIGVPFTNGPIESFNSIHFSHYLGGLQDVSRQNDPILVRIPSTVPGNNKCTLQWRNGGGFKPQTPPKRLALPFMAPECQNARQQEMYPVEQGLYDRVLHLRLTTLAPALVRNHNLTAVTLSSPMISMRRNAGPHSETSDIDRLIGYSLRAVFLAN